MESKTIIIYSSIDGHTKKICDHIRNKLMATNKLVEMININSCDIKIDDIKNFEIIIFASSVRYGKHNKLIECFVKENLHFLNSKKTAFISVNLVARKLEKTKADANPYVKKFFETTNWKPTTTAIFAGKLNYKIYSLADKIMIKLIMLITKGPTNQNTEIEYTNWKDVDNFINKIKDL